MHRLTITLLALILSGAPALAHEFTIALVVSETTRAEARDAFLLASAERDGHPDETSEGHLGGLDSQLELVGAAAEAPRADILVMAGGASAPQALPATVWLVRPDRASPAARAEFLGQGPDGFEARFQAAYGRAPSPEARRIYIAARLVDIGVRALAGVGDPAALEAAIAPWLAE